MLQRDLRVFRSGTAMRVFYILFLIGFTLAAVAIALPELMTSSGL